MKLGFLTLIIGALLVGCSPYRVVNNKVDKSATWSEYRTFAIVDTNRIDATPGNTLQSANDQIKRAIVAELKQRGLQQTNSNPDLLVNLGISVEQKTQTRQTNIREAPPYIGQRRYSWRVQEVPVGTYEQGTISVHVADAQRNAVLWDASVTGVVDRRATSPEAIGEAVDRLFSEFPGSR